MMVSTVGLYDTFQNTAFTTVRCTHGLILFDFFITMKCILGLFCSDYEGRKASEGDFKIIIHAICSNIRSRAKLQATILISLTTNILVSMKFGYKKNILYHLSYFGGVFILTTVPS